VEVQRLERRYKSDREGSVSRGKSIEVQQLEMAESVEAGRQYMLATLRRRPPTLRPRRSVEVQRLFRFSSSSTSSASRVSSAAREGSVSRKGRSVGYVGHPSTTQVSRGAAAPREPRPSRPVSLVREAGKQYTSATLRPRRSVEVQRLRVSLVRVVL
jgi:hypothetical protein